MPPPINTNRQGGPVQQTLPPATNTTQRPPLPGARPPSQPTTADTGWCGLDCWPEPMSVEPIGAQPPECTPESDADGHSSSVAQTNAPKRFSRTTGAMITPGSQTRARRDVITSAAQVRRAPRRQDVYRKMVTVDLDAMAESAAKKAAEAAAEAEAAEAAEEVDTGRGRPGGSLRSWRATKART